MNCIEIIAVPNGYAPLKVREAWVGLRLPLIPAYVGTGGMALSADGYAVAIPDAVEILELYNKSAASWWRANVDVENPAGPFVFDIGSCRLVNGLPSITIPPGNKSEVLVRDFLKGLDQVSLGGIYGAFGLEKDDVEKLEESTVTRPIILVLSNAIAEYYAFLVSGASSERAYQLYLEDGHKALKTLHQAAVKLGIQVAEEEIDRPLSFVDIGIDAGVIEQVGGGIKLTPKGEAIARGVVRLDEDDDTN